jgi:large subunit ribosomal protein L10
MSSGAILSGKKRFVEALAERLKGSSVLVLVDPIGLTVSEDTKLRRSLREAQVGYSVVKNSLLRFAIQSVGVEEFDYDVLNGPTAIATGEDVLSISKALVNFLKENEAFKIKAAYVDGKAISIDMVKAYASIPSKEVMISKILGSLLAPIGSLVRTLDAVSKKDAA